MKVLIVHNVSISLLIHANNALRRVPALPFGMYLKLALCPYVFPDILLFSWTTLCDNHPQVLHSVVNTKQLTMHLANFGNSEQPHHSP